MRRRRTFPLLFLQTHALRHPHAPYPSTIMADKTDKLCNRFDKGYDAPGHNSRMAVNRLPTSNRANAPIGRARSVLIKPYAPSPDRAIRREVLERIIARIRRGGEADILLLESSPADLNMDYIYREAGYDFPQVLMLDAHGTNFIAVENPLKTPFALPTIWIPNILLSCDFLISVSPLRIEEGKGRFSIENLLSLLPGRNTPGRTQYTSWGWIGSLLISILLSLLI